MSHEKLKPLDNINDVLIIRKIERKDPSIVTSSNEMIQAKKCSCLESICDCEINLLIEEQEAIVKKQNEMLLADERGKLALLNEIAALKERKESREELLRRRQYALDIEKERARKIASLPPPLPKSVKLLLKQNVSDDELKLNKPDVQMPNELTAIHITPVEISSKNTENKENIIDPEELEFKQKTHEEWDIKAKQRYYEALKKDRQKEEYSKIMKQIQSAELLKRQEMAKNISADKKGMPCPLSDKFETAKKQVNMEDAADKIFKKSNTKEHVIEDIEGYQDHYEEKYKKIDSTSETKMIDCVPSFVKENYDYLLEDDSKFIGGKNFSGFDDSSSDVLNQAYIETLPGVDELHGTGEIYHEISHWDKLRSSLETEIEQNYKPLLAAAIVEVPKKESKDQAVETDSVSVPAEDKAVETDAQLKNDQSSPSPLAAFNFINAGVMAHKRRPRLPVMSTYEEIPLPDMHQRDVHYVMPSVPESKDLIESWSPSTYCSLPSKHGLSALPNGSKSAVCDICVAEKKKDQIKDNFIQETTATFQLFNEEKYRNLNSPSEKIPLSEFVQQLAKKHLETNSIKSYQQSKNITKSFGDSTYSNTKIINPAFEKEIIGKSKVGIFSEPIKSPINEFISVSSKNALPEEEKKFWTSPLVVEKLLPATKTETSIKVNESKKDMIESEESQDNIHFKIKDNELQKSPNEYSEYDYEAKRIQAIHQVLSRNFPQFSFEDNGKKEDKNSSKEAKQFTSVQNEIIAKPHVYHDLSTIQEVDSALTASSLQLSQSKLSDTSKTRGEKDVPQEEKLKDLDQSTEKLKIVSLLDPPDTEITELAKSIHFVPETEKKMNHSLETSKTAFTNSSTDKSTSSKIHSSTPTLSSSSYSSVSVSTPSLLYSGSSCPSVSAESKVNENNQDVIISGYISGSEIQGMSESEVLNSKQDEKDMNTVVSGYISEMDETQVSTDNISNPKKEMNQRHSAVSKFGDQEIQHVANSGISNVISEKNNMHPVTSKYLNDLIMPKMTKTGISHFYHENEDNKQFTKDDSMISNSTSHVNDSLKFLPLTPHSDVSSPNTYNDTNYSLLKFGDFKKITSNNVNFLKQGQFLTEITSKRNFKTLTPHSIISSSNESNNIALKNDLQKDCRSNFQYTIPHSSVSSSSKFVDRDMKRNDKDDNTGTFKSMTPHSNISSPSELTTHNFEKCQDENFNASLKPISPSKLDNLVSKSIQDNNSAGSFKTLTPHSNISSPSSDIFSLNDKNKDYVSSSGSFKSLTPHSNISSPVSNAVLSLDNVPIGDVSNSRKVKDKILSGTNEIKPMILRFDISTDSLTSNTLKNKSSEGEHVSQLNCNLTVKTLLKPTNHCLATQSPRIKITSGAVGNRKYGERFKNKFHKKHKGLQSITAKQYALACSSDFFVPSMNENLGSLNENINKDLPDVSISNNGNANKPESDHQMIISDDLKKNGTKIERISKANESDSNSKILQKGISEKTGEEETQMMRSKEIHQTQVQSENFRKQCSNLQGLSSASSSSENLSVISRSKVVYQSTPIKNLSELLQEPGILEEPNLTLITTNLSYKMDTTNVRKDPLTSKDPTHNEIIVVPSQTQCRTPTNQSTDFLCSPDTPSMISFLQHEISCKQAGNDNVQLPSENPATQNLQENNTPVLREVKRSLFQKTGYKERTKRLWNNLEEVRKKNLAEERKKEIENNRKKAKEFAKKLTPKQRRK